MSLGSWLVHVQQLHKVLITFWEMVLRKMAGNLFINLGGVGVGVEEYTTVTKILGFIDKHPN